MPPEKPTEPPKARTRRARARGTLRPFVALDGESADINGEHCYFVMTSSTGATVTNLEGLSTLECLQFIVKQSAGTPAPILVAFGWNYDVNMLLRDVPHEGLVKLWERGSLVLEYPDSIVTLEWIPSKLFAITAEDKDTGVTFTGKVYDVFGFFQSSFVNALKSWGLGEREFIAEMKEKRGKFRVDELDEITRYSIEECVLLVEMMDAVRSALHDVELRPRSWLGAGAIASTLLSRFDVDDHLPELEPPPALHDVILRAYFGGRTEVFRQGVFADAVSWDINSAYPAAALALPSMRGQWKRRREYDPAEPYAIWRCEWDIPDAFVAPFPFRDKRSIYYPTCGEGYYHASEVAAAIAAYGDRIRVSSGYVFRPADDAEPFAFLAEQYDYRQQLKADGHPGEKVLKLGINSVYGKLAQGNSRDGRRPRFQSYYWAGKITADTRARVFETAFNASAGIVAIATDGLVFGPEKLGPKLQPTKGLGGWERTRYTQFFVAQPGMYHAYDRATRSLVKHSRGFFTKEIDFPKLRRVWLQRGPLGSVECNSHRFIGLGSALMRTDFGVWRTWQDGTRRVSLYSSRKEYNDLEPERVKTLTPPARIRAGLSDVYVPKHAAIELDPDSEDWIQGTEQPLRVF